MWLFRIVSLRRFWISNKSRGGNLPEYSWTCLTASILSRRSFCLAPRGQRSRTAGPVTSRSHQVMSKARNTCGNGFNIKYYNMFCVLNMVVCLTLWRRIEWVRIRMTFVKFKKETNIFIYLKMARVTCEIVYFFWRAFECKQRMKTRDERQIEKFKVKYKLSSSNDKWIKLEKR